MPALLTERLAELAPEARARYLDDKTTRGLFSSIVAELRREGGVISNLRWYTPRGAAADLRETTDTEVLLSGPAGTGKSIGVLERLFDLAVHNPGMRALIVRKTAKSLTSSALVTWKSKVVNQAVASEAVYFYGGSAEEPAQYRFWNGSKVMLAGMDNADKVMSTEYDFIFVQEAIELTQDDWERLLTRLRNGVLDHMQLVGDTNPSSNTHWLKVRCDAGTTRMLRSWHTDNPDLYDDDGALTPRGAQYLGILETLTGPRKARLLDGEWVGAEGLVYPEWDAQVHLVDPYPIPDSWPRWMSVDFGMGNPFVAQWWALDPDGVLVLYREIYETEKLVEDHARTILALTRDLPEGTDWMGTPTEELRRYPWVETPPQDIICDHDKEDRATLERHLGTTTRAAQKTVLDGIQKVSERLRPQGPTNQPRLVVMRDCVVERDPRLKEAGKPQCTAEEFDGYVWDLKAKERGKEQPLKVDDHGMDTTRYMVAELDLVPGGRVRVL